MHKEKAFLAIIPARGGSKRLPRKNILDLNGKPLIAWSIEAGLNSKYVDKVVVTSDDREILDVADKYGAEIIIRPDDLASDMATTVDTVEHVLENIDSYEYLVLLQPTSPLRTYKHIDEAIQLLEQKNADAIIGVCETDHSPLWTNTLPNSKSMDNFLSPEIIGKRSQDLDKHYRINGAIYICKTDKFIQEKTLFIKNNNYAYEMERSASVDIDNHIDFILAGLLLNEAFF
jgi:CMP-N,N'-diacetyllegionaminic acid synthase